MTTIERIFNLIKFKNIQQKTLAEYLGVTQSTLSEWKKGNLKPSMEDIIEIAHYFNVTTDYLLGLSDEIDGLSNRRNIDKELVSKGLKEFFKDLIKKEHSIEWLSQHQSLTIPRLKLFQKYTIKSPDENIPTFSEISAMRDYTHNTSGYFGILYNTISNENYVYNTSINVIPVTNTQLKLAIWGTTDVDDEVLEETKRAGLILQQLKSEKAKRED
jgi:transcriptional regulator with XRE-family HTH domain